MCPSVWAFATEGPCLPEAGTRDPGPGGSPPAACHLGVHSDPREDWAIRFLSLPIQAQVTEAREAFSHFQGKCSRDHLLSYWLTDFQVAKPVDVP